MTIPHVDVRAQYAPLLDELRERIGAVLDSGRFILGPEVRAFEQEAAEYLGVGEAIGVANGTDALVLVLDALGVGPGDEVVCPSFTFFATAEAVSRVGATPVFCDVDLATFNTTAEHIEEVLTERTVGIVPVHLFGLCAELDPILELARRRGLWVVEDAACAFGSWYRGAHAGTFGDAGAFSFHARKSITTGEGGMVTTGSGELAALCRSLRDHGASRSDHQRHSSEGAFLLSEYRHLGYNYRLTDIQAALGCAQLERAEWILGERRRVAAGYDEALAEVEWLAPPVIPEGHVHGYQA